MNRKRWLVIAAIGVAAGLTILAWILRDRGNFVQVVVCAPEMAQPIIDELSRNGIFSGAQCTVGCGILVPEKSANRARSIIASFRGSLPGPQQSLIWTEGYR
jgi:flagellar biosynthesis/type III secretory pathway M-ring protein FliF/YscJ